jgi:hypothetical protein
VQDHIQTLAHLSRHGVSSPALSLEMLDLALHQAGPAGSPVTNQLAEPMPPLPAVQYGGRDWEVAGCTEFGVRLRVADSLPRVMHGEELARPVGRLRIEGRWWNSTLNEERCGILLECPSSGEKREVSIADLAHATEPIFITDRQQSTEGVFWGRTWKVEGIEHDPKVRSLRLLLRRTDVSQPSIFVPFEALKAPVAVRLQGREREGAFMITRERGRLIARQGEAQLEVDAAAVVGDYVEIDSYALGRIPIPSALARFWAEETGAVAPLSVFQPSGVAAALKAHGLGALPSGEIEVSVAVGTDLIWEQLAFIRSLPPGMPLAIRQWDFREDVPPGTPPDAVLAHRAVVHAILGRARIAPVQLCVTPGKLEPGLERRLRDAGVEIVFSDVVVHQKSLATPVCAIVHTASYAPRAPNRVDCAVRVHGHTARLFYESEVQAGQGNSFQERRDVLARLAAAGLAVDSPEIGVGHAAKVYWVFAHAAQSSIELFVNEFAHPDYTEALLHRARDGVATRINLSLAAGDAVDGVSARMIRRAKRRDPDLPFEILRFPSGLRRIHLNAIFVDGAFGAVGTLYPWPKGLGKMDSPAGTEHVAILQGSALHRLREGLQAEVDRIGTPQHYYLPLDAAGVPDGSGFLYKGTQWPSFVAYAPMWLNSTAGPRSKA